jgi:hypothetical protein
MLLKGSPVLKNDMLFAYFSYFWDFHEGWSLAHPLPLWSSSYQCGMPMHAYWQSGYLYPITWILFGPISPHVGIHLFYAFHFSLAIYGFLKLGPYLRLKPFAAYWAGLCFALSGTMLARYEHATFLAGWAWLPLVLAAFLALRSNPGPGTACLYAAAAAMQTLGGHPQASAAAALLIGGFTVESGLRAFARSGPGVAKALPRRACAWIMAGHLLALVWCLPLLVPFFDLVHHTVRYDSSAWETGLTGKIPAVWEHSDFTFTRFATGGFHPLHFLSLLAPYALGSPSDASWWGGELWGEVFLYIGGLGLFFCAFASPRRANRDMRWLWAIGLIGLWFAFGSRLGASQVLYRLPFFSHLRIPARWIILFVFALAPLSAHGLQRFAARPIRGRALPVAALAALGFAIAFACLRSAHSAFPALLRMAHELKAFADPGKDYGLKLSILMGRYVCDAGFLALSAVAAWIYARRGRRFLPALFLVLMLDLLRVHWDHFYLFPASYYRVPPASARVLDQTSRPFWRVNHALAYPGNEKWLMHNDPDAHFDLLEREKTALSFGIHAVFGYRHVSAYLPLMWPWEPELPYGGRSGRYLFSNMPMDSLHGDSLKRLDAFGDIIAYEVRDWKPRFEALRSGPRAGNGAPCPGGFSGYRDLCVREPRDGSLEVRGNWKAGDTLLFRERYSEGWRYRMEGGAWNPVREGPDGFMILTAEKESAGMEIGYHPGRFYALAGACYGVPALSALVGLLIGFRRRRL